MVDGTVNGSSNGSAESVDLDLQICQLQEKLLKLVEHEDLLREEKNRVAGDYRQQITEVRKNRAKATKELKDLQAAEVETEGTLIIEGAEAETTATA